MTPRRRLNMLRNIVVELPNGETHLFGYETSQEAFPEVLYIPDPGIVFKATFTEIDEEEI